MSELQNQLVRSPSVTETEQFWEKGQKDYGEKNQYMFIKKKKKIERQKYFSSYTFNKTPKNLCEWIKHEHSGSQFCILQTTSPGTQLHLEHYKSSWYIMSNVLGGTRSWQKPASSD